MTNRLNIAVCGTGAIVERAHLPGLATDGNTAIYLCGRNEKRLAELSLLFPIEKVFPSFEQCLQTVTLDAVIIATPNFLHGEAAFRAIAHGLPILLEKPLAHEISVAREIAARAAAANVPIHLNLPQPHRPSMTMLKTAIDDGRFGRIRSIDVAMMRNAGIPGFGTWFTQKHCSGGGVLADLGPHMLDLALHFAGDYCAQLISAHTWSDFGPKGKGLGDWSAHRNITDAISQFDVEDRALLQLRTSTGTLISCDLAWAYHGPDENRTRIIGDRGGCLYREAATGEESALLVYPVSTAPLVCSADHDRLGPAWVSVVQNFLRSVRNNDKRSQIIEAMVVAEIINEAYERSR